MITARKTPRTAATLLTIAAALALGAGCSKNGPPAVVLLADVAAPGSGEANLSRTLDGRAVMSWLEPDGTGTALRFSLLDDDRWREAQTVASGTDWFVNWADFPSLVPIDDELWAAHWLVKSADLSYAYDVAIAISRDAGRSWSEPRVPHTDGTTTEHGFVSMFPAAGGIGALWLDGRKTVNEFDADDPQASGMTLRAAVLTAGGELTQEALVDELVCDCCQTDVALTDSGTVAAYRNRTAGEVRDIYVARNVGGLWQPGVAVADDGWRIAGCPVNGPAIAARGQDVAVAWFTAADAVPALRIAFSTDGGAQFGAARDLARGDTLGRVDLLLLEDGSAVVSSLRDSGNGSAEVRLRRVTAAGERGRPLVVATTSAGRLSGFPRLALLRDRIVVAWNDATDSATQVRSALVDVEALPSPGDTS